MGNIYWLASYPKSGNTWMRILLTNYQRDAEQPANINSLDDGPIASARQIFDDNVGIEASDLTQDEIERYRPYVYEQLSEQAKEPLYLKVHDAFTYTSSGYPLISKNATAGAIYLIRNPLDVAVSFAHHSGSSVKKMVRKMGETDFAFVDRPDQIHNQLYQKLLTWSEHVLSWVDEPGLRILVVRYEDLHSNTLETFRSVIRFCGMAENQARIEKSVGFSQFEQLQKQETEHGFDEKVPGQEAFFRKGQVGSWTEELTPELVQKLITDHAPVMRRFGYLSESGEVIY